MPTQEFEYVVESKSMGKDELAAALNGQGYATVNVETVTNEPVITTPPESAAEPVVVATPEPAAAAPPVESDPPADVTLNDHLVRARQARHEKEEASKKKLVRKLTAAEEELTKERGERERLTRELVEARRSAPAPVATPAPEPAFVPKPKPKFADFVNAEEPSEAFSEVLTRHIIDETNREREHKDSIAAGKRKQEEDANKAIIEATRARWQPKIEAAKKAYSDYETLLQGPEGKTRTSQLMDYELDVDPEGYKVQYWLLKNPKECERIADLTKDDGKASQEDRQAHHRLVIREFAKISDLIAKETPPVVDDPDEDEIDEAEEFPEATPEAVPAGREARAAAAGAPPVPAKQAEAPPAAAKPAAPAPKPLPKPESMPRTVGSRAAAHTKRYEDMSPDEQRALPIDEVRRLMGL